MNESTKSLLFVHISVFLFGLSGLFGKFLDMNPLVIVFGRVFFAVIFLYFFLLWTKTFIKLKNTKQLKIFALCGFLLAVHWVTFFHSIQISSVAIGLLSFSTFPIFTTFLEPYFFKEKIKISNIVLAFVTFGGIFLVIPEFSTGSSILQGVFWGMISGLTFALLSILNKKHTSDFSPFVIAFYQDIFAGLFILPFLFFISFSLNFSHILLLVLLGVVFTAIAHSLFIKGLEKTKAQTASIIASLEPIYGIIFAIFLLSEIPSWREIVGGMIILGATLYASTKKS